MRFIYLFTFTLIALLDDPLFSKPLISSLSFRDRDLISSNDFNYNLDNYSVSSEPNWIEVFPKQDENTNKVK